MRSRKLGNLTYQEVRNYLSSQTFPRLLLPVGTLEAHGPHLPLSTDTICATGFALRLAEKLDALVAPPIHYGITNSLAAYSGSNTIRESIFSELVNDVLESFVLSGFIEIVLLNGHGGNNVALELIVKNLSKRKRATRMIVIHWWILGKEIAKQILKTGLGHAGSDETALVVAFAPELVLSDKIPADDQVTFIRDGFRAYPLNGSILLYEPGDKFSRIPNENESTQFVDALVLKTHSLVEKAFQDLRKNIL